MKYKPNHFLKLSAFTLFALAINSLAFTQPLTEIKISASNWESLTSKDGTGYFFDLVDIIYPKHQYQVSTTILPLRRSIQWALQGKSDMVAGIYKTNGDIAINYSKHAILVDSIDLITLKRKNLAITNLQQLANRRLGSIIGMNIQASLPENTEYYEYKSHRAMLKMLHKERIDAVVGFSSDIDPIAKELDIAVTTTESILKINLYVGFSQSKKSRQLKTIFDNEYEKLVTNGKVKALIDNYHPYLNAGNYPFKIVNKQTLPLE